MNDQSTQSTGANVGTSQDEFQALQAIISALQHFDPEVRYRILESAATFLGISVSPSKLREIAQSSTSVMSYSAPLSLQTPFSEHTEMSPKDFLIEKAPKTDVERIACLAYYLTHYRTMPHFKTLDISMLNTEAAQPKFSNTTYSINNAMKLNYIVPSKKGHRQLGALGERFVQALPDRNAAKEILLTLRRKNRNKRKRISGTVAVSSEGE